MEIKTCPCCGEKPDYSIEPDSFGSRTGEWHKIVCNSWLCLTVEASEPTKDEAIKSWNTRVDNGLHHIEEALRRVKKIHKPKYRHNCHEWDGLEIDEFWHEFKAGMCFKEWREE